MKGGKIPTLIDRFEGPWFFLSNFYITPPIKLWITDSGAIYAYEVPDSTEEVYASTEHAYQASKFLDERIRERFRFAGVTPGDAKYWAHNMKKQVREDWEQVNVGIMRDLLKQKFTYSILKRKLIATFQAELIEGNVWHDNFWGSCICPNCEQMGPGENWLGKLLTELRNSLVPNLKGAR